MSSGNFKPEVFFSFSFAKGGSAMITYEPFWDYLDWHEISTYTLITKHHVSSSTINCLRHNQPVSTATIDKLCEILKCPVDDVIMYVEKAKSSDLRSG